MFLTNDVRQPWTNYVNNGNKHLIVGADVRSEYSNIRYLHLIIGKAQKLFQVTNMISEGRNHVPAANTNLLYNKIIKTNNQIIKTNNQIFKITVLRIRPRLTDVGSKAWQNWSNVASQTSLFSSK